MPRLPAGFHPQAAGRGTPTQSWRPGLRGSGMQPIRVTPVTAYTAPLQGIPLQGGQGQSTVAADGTATIITGPMGLGVIWYPAQATVSSSVGAADNSTVAVYLGPAALGNLQGGQSYAGGGDTVSLAVPPMAPGQYFTAIWSGGTPGSIVQINILGTMNALTSRPT